MKWIWLAALALVLWRSPSLRLTRRIPHRVRTGEAVSPPRGRLTIGSASTWVALLAAAACLAVLGWPLGALVASLVGLAIRLGIPRLSTREQQRTRLELARGLPPGIDLLAAALRAGMTDAAALDVVRSASDGPISNHLGLVARALRLGADPRDAWASAIAEPILAPLAEGMIRSARTGAAVGPILDRIAEDSRARYFDEAQTTARSISVRAVLPLGLCYLPSFMLLSVVPVVAAYVSGLKW